MKYDLNEIIDRSGTNSSKWETYTAGNSDELDVIINSTLEGDGLLPMWVADMDFQTPKPVVEALLERTQHGIFGYTLAPESYFKSITNWFSRRYNWEVKENWIVPAPGVVPAIQFAINTFCSAGDKILVQGPVYHPFYRIIKAAKCEVVSNSLVLENNKYQMDFGSLSKQLSDPLVKMIILCSPHNPVGRVWTAKELKEFSKLCHENDVLIIADEIHCDLVFSEYTFVPFGTVDPAFHTKTLICTAASKTFNLAGMHLANIVIPNEGLRNDYKSYMSTNSLSGGLNPLALLATEVAYNTGDEWLEQVLEYIWGNYKLLQRFFIEKHPEIILTELQGTYLAWADFRALNQNVDGLEILLQKEAKLLFNQGYIFGREGNGFQRINIACPRAILELCIARLATTLKKL